MEAAVGRVYRRGGRAGQRWEGVLIIKHFRHGLLGVVLAVAVASGVSPAEAGGFLDTTITKTDSPDPVTAGSNLTYTITVSSSSAFLPVSGSWLDTLPTGTTFVSLNAPPGSVCFTPPVGSGGSVACNFSGLLDPSNLVYTLTVAVDPSLAGGTVITNTATVSPDVDSNPFNNTATAMTTVSGGYPLAVSPPPSGAVSASPYAAVQPSMPAGAGSPRWLAWAVAFVGVVVLNVLTIGVARRWRRTTT